MNNTTNMSMNSKSFMENIDIDNDIAYVNHLLDRIYKIYFRSFK